MTEKSALVLGATGRVGGELARALANDGWTVYGAARGSSPETVRALERNAIPFFQYDVTQDDPARLPDVDVLFLEIWDPKQPDRIWPINYYGVGRVVERYAGVADVVNGCTINVYGDSPDAPSEDTPCRPTSEYGRSRYAQERLIDYFAVRSGKKAIHLRYAHANTASGGVVWKTARKILAGESLGPDPDARIQVIAMEDFVRVTRKSVEFATTPPVAVNCCHPRVWSMRELAKVIQRRLPRGEVVFDRDTGGIENSAYADVTRMLDWFGDPTVSLDTVIDRAVDGALAEAK